MSKLLDNSSDIEDAIKKEVMSMGQLDKLAERYAYSFNLNDSEIKYRNMSLHRRELISEKVKFDPKTSGSIILPLLKVFEKTNKILADLNDNNNLDFIVFNSCGGMTIGVETNLGTGVSEILSGRAELKINFDDNESTHIDYAIIKNNETGDPFIIIELIINIFTKK